MTGLSGRGWRATSELEVLTECGLKAAVAAGPGKSEQPGRRRIQLSAT